MTAHSMTRREALRLIAGSTIAAALPLRAAEQRKTSLGIGMHSYGAGWKAGKERHPKAHFRDALTFLEYAHSIGAAGVQVSIGLCDDATARALREKSEQFQMHLEAQTSIPKDSTDLERFTREVVCARQAGASIIRTACLGGRRYETFGTLAEFQRFKSGAQRSLGLAERVLSQHQMRLAVENHKDWLIEDFVGILKEQSSPWIGVCVDVGNNLALLENPYEVVEALAPWAISTHIKDMAVQPSAAGFLLSEVPIGEGFLDLKRMSDTLRKHNPTVKWNLEMITRNPLLIPCLTDRYWETMPERRAAGLAKALALIQQHTTVKPLPRVEGLSADAVIDFEDRNVRLSLQNAHLAGL